MKTTNKNENKNETINISLIKDELESFAEIAIKNDLIVISDEIYDKIIYKDEKHISFPQLGEDVKERTILVNGVSKSYSMTGWRIGYAAGNSSVISAMNNLSGQSTSNTTSISQKAAIEAFSGPQEPIKEMLKEFKDRRDFITSALNEINGVQILGPSPREQANRGSLATFNIEYVSLLVIL